MRIALVAEDYYPQLGGVPVRQRVVPLVRRAYQGRDVPPPAIPPVPDRFEGAGLGHLLRQRSYQFALLGIDVDDDVLAPVGQLLSAAAAQNQHSAFAHAATCQNS